MKDNDPLPKSTADADALAALVAQARQWSDARPLPDRGWTFPEAVADAIGDRVRRRSPRLRAIRAGWRRIRDGEGRLNRP
ncbi:hypothetical protein [Embleya sp. NPDC050493]|uniref:hypothetical protein n=1 Tax=Embleya sp. NPDC050493 TaxID=3363989 RepID=UPI00378862CA